MEAILVTLFRHNLWANSTLIGYCASAGEAALAAMAPGGFGPVKETLVHIIANEEGYLAHITGEPHPDPLFGRGAPPGMPELAERAQQSGAELIRLAETLDPGTRLTGTWQGEPYDMPVSIPLLQAINHGTEHRGHVRSALSVMGATPPAIDMWDFEEAGLA